MRNRLMVGIGILLCAGASLVVGPPAIAFPVTSGFVTMDSDDIGTPGGQLPPHQSLAELLANGGFETGNLAPWTISASWAVVGNNPHSGAFCAFDVGNNWIRQNFPPIDTGDVLSITFWMRQPEAQISAFDLFYSDNTFDEDIWFVPTTWAQQDITFFLRPAGSLLTGIRLWGYSGGPQGPDETFLDDVSIEVKGATAVEGSTWGQVKSLFD